MSNNFDIYQSETGCPQRNIHGSQWERADREASSTGCCIFLQLCWGQTTRYFCQLKCSLCQIRWLKSHKFLPCHLRFTMCDVTSKETKASDCYWQVLVGGKREIKHARPSVVRSWVVLKAAFVVVHYDTLREMKRYLRPIFIDHFRAHPTSYVRPIQTAARGPHAAQKQLLSGPARKAEINPENRVVLAYRKTLNLKLCVALQHSTHNVARCCECVSRHDSNGVSQTWNVKLTMKTVGLNLPGLKNSYIF